MDRKQVTILGVAGAVAAAALIGGLAIHNMRSDGELASDSRTEDGAYQEDADSASSEMDDYNAQIREYDRAKEELLSSLVFYEGTATIQERYSAVSGVSGDSPVIGSVAMVSEDIFVYDPSTEKCYLVARRISLLGDDVKDFEFAGVSGTATAKVMGILTEYYGNGVLQAYDEADALAGQKGYYLSFLANPVRIDCINELIYTNPPVKNTYWVQVIGVDEVTMVATGVFTPEELASEDAGLIPGMTTVTGERTYNQSETLIYEYTGGRIVPKGTFYYDFKKTTYAEVKDFLLELKKEAQKDVLLEEASETLSGAWKDTVSAANDLKTLDDTSASLKSYTDNFAGDSAADASAARNEAAMLANGAEFRGEFTRAFDALNGLEAEDGTIRKLEDFSLEDGENGDKQGAANAMGSLLPVLKEYLSQYRSTFSSLRENADELSAYLSGEDPQEVEITKFLQDIRTQTEELSRMSTCLESMSSGIYGVLLSYDANEGNNETEYAALARLCAMWENTLNEFMSGMDSVDVEEGVTIPDDYPEHIVPILDNAVAAIYEVQDDNTISLTLKTDLSIDEVVEYYKSALKDIPNLSAFEMNGIATLSGNTGEYELNILATANQLGGSEITMVQITLITVG